MNNKNVKSNFAQKKCNKNSIYQKVPSINFNQVYIEKQEREKTRMGV